MISRFISRGFQPSVNLMFSRLASSDSNLARLRKKTGLAFSLCRQALEMHQQDLEAAESWLKAEAAKQGWEKAEKVKDRTASQGLIGVCTRSDNSLSAMIEINCETDFVARNEVFVKLVSALTQQLTCIPIATQHSDNGNVSKIRLGEEHLKQLNPQSIVESISKLGENIKVSRASLLLNNRQQEGVQLVGYTHAVGGKIHSDDCNVSLGKYGTIIALKAGPIINEEGVDVRKTAEEVDTIGKQLSQHIIGMNPITIEPKSEVSEEEPTSLLQQEFIFDEDIKVIDFLRESNITVLDFERFECGVNE